MTELEGRASARVVDIAEMQGDLRGFRGKQDNISCKGGIDLDGDSFYPNYYSKEEAETVDAIAIAFAFDQIQ